MILPFTGNCLLEQVQSLTSVSCKVAILKTELKIESEIMDTKDPASISIVSDFPLIVTNTVNGLVLYLYHPAGLKIVGIPPVLAY